MDIGLIGLAAMGANLALNFASKGFSVAVFNRTAERTRAFMAGPGGGAGARIRAAFSLGELVSLLDKPRKLLRMVKAGEAVDGFIGELVPLLERGDMIIDGGNSRFTDTERRCAAAEAAGLLYVGLGVSGGEEGALRGPSLMAGGSEAAWEHLRPLFEAICARTAEGEACCGWFGPGGAGHFVKMVHNGIEYADMQLICEAYQLMKDGLGLSNGEMSGVFAEWNGGELESYLVEITRDILRHTDGDGNYTVDLILDAAGQKGTGRWTVESALEEGTPLPVIAEAVFARCLSAMKEERLEAERAYGRAERPGAYFAERRPEALGRKEDFLSGLRRAVYAAKIIAYAQGFALLRSAAARRGWTPSYGKLATVWRGGCIIRSAFLGKIGEAFSREPELENLLLDGFFSGELKNALGGLRGTVSAAAELGLPCPALMSALSWFDGWSRGRLAANLLQAQRDYFGAHGYERLDRPRGETFHTKWKNENGK